MPDYYLDIETNSKGQKPDPQNDEILTIQFHQLGGISGEKIGDLTILKSWESSEEDVLKEFHSILNPCDPFWFIPVGTNLTFDLFALHNRWKKIGLDVPLQLLLYEHPHLDIKPIIVVFNMGSFKGASLDAFTGKKGKGAMVPTWYQKGQYREIEDYIRDEADAFVSFYQKLKAEMPRLSCARKKDEP